MAIEGNPLVLAERAFGDLFGKAKDSINNLQKDLASVLPSMPGMPVAKYFDFRYQPVRWYLTLCPKSCHS